MKRPAVAGTIRAGAALTLVFALNACGDGESKSSAAGTARSAVASSKNAHVVLISIDTLRSDHLPAYGGVGTQTPAIDALRRDSVLYTHAYSHMPLTLPSHTTVFTGLLPAASGVRDNVGYPLDKSAIESGAQPHLAKLLKARGYATGGAISAFVLQGRSGISAGFDFYDDDIEMRTKAGLGELQRPGSESLARLLGWLQESRQRAAAQPVLLFLHLYEPHTPYNPAAPFAAKGKTPYDGEIAAADDVVGKLIAELKTRGIYDSALIILFSDHGEGLGEHGEDEHGVLLYREAIQVPLLVKLPGRERAGSRVDQPVGLFDIAPTVLSVIGAEPPPAMTGRSLLEVESAPVRRIYSETFYPRLHFGWSDLHSLADGRRHFIDGPDPELYDLVADPAEKSNLRDSERRTFGELRQEMSRYDRVLQPPAAIDEETRQAMASLGYLGGAAAPTSGPMADPKRKVGTLRDLRLGMERMAKNDFTGAIEALRRTLADNPRMADGWEYLGRAYERLGDRDAAIAAFQSALEASGGSTHVAGTLASLFLNMNRLADAETHARMAMASSPGLAHGVLAQVAKERRDLPTAEREALASLAEKGDRIGPLVTLADVLHAGERYDEALARVREAERVFSEREAKDPDLLRGLKLVEGRVHADLGNVGEAERAFRTEIERFPEDLRAYSSLAILYALVGRVHEAGGTLRTMVEKNPAPSAYAEAVKTYRVLKDDAGATRLLRMALGKFPSSSELRALTSSSGLVERATR